MAQTSHVSQCVRRWPARSDKYKKSNWSACSTGYKLGSTLLSFSCQASFLNVPDLGRNIKQTLLSSRKQAYVLRHLGTKILAQVFATRKKGLTRTLVSFLSFNIYLRMKKKSVKTYENNRFKLEECHPIKVILQKRENIFKILIEA